MSTPLFVVPIAASLPARGGSRSNTVLGMLGDTGGRGEPGQPGVSGQSGTPGADEGRRDHV
jgi:hypothetical protein